MLPAPGIATSAVSRKAACSGAGGMRRQCSGSAGSDYSSTMHCMGVHVVVAGGHAGGGRGGGACSGTSPRPPPETVKLEGMPSAASHACVKLEKITAVTGLISAPPSSSAQPGRMPQMLPSRRAAAAPAAQRRAAAIRQTALQSKQRRRAHVACLEQDVQQLSLRSKELQGHLHGLAANAGSLRVSLTCPRPCCSLCNILEGAVVEETKHEAEGLHMSGGAAAAAGAA